MTTETAVQILEAAAELGDRIARLVAAVETALAATKSTGSPDATDPALKNLEAALKPLSAGVRCVHHPKRNHVYVVGGVVELRI